MLIFDSKLKTVSTMRSRSIDELIEKKQATAGATADPSTALLAEARATSLRMTM
jgi:hypothetical protein